MDERSYFLINFNPLNIDDDFNAFLSYLTHIPALTLVKEENQVVIHYKEGGLQVIFKKAPSNTTFNQKSSMVIQCDARDFETLRIFRRFAPKLNYRLYNPSLGCFLPMNENLVEVSQLILKEKAVESFRAKGYNPIFTHLPSSTYFAQPIGKQSVHLINTSLLEYFMEYGVDLNPMPEFSYEVAVSLIDFVTLFDQELIPLNFYSYYQKPLKVINHSGFDIYHINRKVFIKPWICFYNKEKQGFDLTTDKSALNIADKVRPGETLDTAFKRILKEELRIADDYYRAKVIKVEFDRDRENILTPRLWVAIYVKDVQSPQIVQEKSQRGWTSLKDQVN